MTLVHEEDAPWGAVPPPRDDPDVRAQIRRLRAESGQLLGVLDDDPTGSQCVHGVDVVFALEPDEYARALTPASPTCFVLTNSRSQPERVARTLTRDVAAGLHEVAAGLGRPLQLVSRSDSTLRGHVMAEVDTLALLARERGEPVDAVLLAPAFLEAGRVTAGDVHWARVDGRMVPVGSTEFARDATFGYTASDLRRFVAEVSGGQVDERQVLSISLEDIRSHGPSHVAELIGRAEGQAFVVVNAVTYSDLECVALASLQAQQTGQRLLFRTGPSMVRALDGQESLPPVSPAEVWAGSRPEGHGLVVVGSHVGSTSRQVAALRAADDAMSVVTVDVPELLALGAADRDAYVAELGRRVADGVRRSDVLLMTSRSLVTGTDRDTSLQIAREVSAALSDVVRSSLDEPPAWIVAKGGITSHDVAVRGLGMRRARVEGQFFPGVVSLLRTVDADPRVAWLARTSYSPATSATTTRWPTVVDHR